MEDGVYQGVKAVNISFQALFEQQRLLIQGVLDLRRDLWV